MFENKKILILGMARSGYESAKFLSKYNNEILVTDAKKQNNELVNELNSLGVNVVITNKQDELLDSTYDYVIKNPGIKYDNPTVVKAKQLGIKVINEVEMAYNFLDKSINIIGVTGSNGKTTTVSLVYELMNKTFDNVYLAGNIGTPLSHYVNDIKQDSYLILEISDHQLCDMYNFKTNVSILTNVTPTHLDFHPSYEVYKDMKKRIFNNHTINDLAIINSDNKDSLEITEDIKSDKVYFGKNNNNLCYYDNIGIYYNNELVVKFDEIILKGEHNYQNIMAAICAVKKYNVSNDIIKEVLSSFKGIEHRLEFVDEINKVKFYNDSKATNCVSTITALNSFNEPTILLLGGLDRGHSFHDLDKAMKNVKTVVCFGETKDRIEKFCKDLNITCYKNNTLKEAMNIVKDICTNGDVVLLSPACASWDQYEKFEDRGNEFKKLVEDLIK